MNKVIAKAKNNINNQKKEYLFLSIITLLGIISGILFIFFISNTDKLLVKDELILFFTNLKENNLDYISSLINSFSSNLLYFIIIWVLGISIIGIPIIIFMLFFKGFIFGFSISSIINIMGFKGILVAISYHLPHNLILLILYLLISFYAINFSVRLFRLLFLKENLNLNSYFKRYNQIIIFCLLISIFCSLLEVFLTPILINFFL